MEFAIVWVCICVRSGALKSPAFDAAVKPLRNAELKALRDYEAAYGDYETAMQWHEKRHAEWKRDKKATALPEKPAPPVCVRFTLSDLTIEALAPVLQENPRGVLVARDELAAWVRSFNQYKSKGGSDAAAWLELSRAGTLIVDRKTGVRRIHVPRAAVSVCGTIQPGTLAAVMTPEHFESGLAARLLIVRPPEQLKNGGRSDRPVRTSCETMSG